MSDAIDRGDNLGMDTTTKGSNGKGCELHGRSQCNWCNHNSIYLIYSNRTEANNART